jgi:hypothetical protein
MSDTIAGEHAGAGPLAAALEYAERGWRVLPLHGPDPAMGSGCACQDPQCNSPAKHPQIKGGHKRATTDRETIERWWRKWPAAGIGTPNGLTWQWAR